MFSVGMEWMCHSAHPDASLLCDVNLILHHFLFDVELKLLVLVVELVLEVASVHHQSQPAWRQIYKYMKSTA